MKVLYPDFQAHYEYEELVAKGLQRVKMFHSVSSKPLNMQEST